ncbi:MAG TPA: hypothetical protein VEF05_13085, partial [Terriglobales bacterium]|nr:hypothetical protein [Terriglobales bacterium]
IHMLSRHGLLPQTHKRTAVWPARWDQSSTRSVRGLLRRIRLEVAKAEKENADWRAVIDSMRPLTQNIWRSLQQPERRRFLRHLRAYWDVHRHRVAPEIGKLLEGEKAEGRLQIHAGRITEYQEKDDAVEVSYGKRGHRDSQTLCVDYVINCSGPDGDCRKVGNPLLSDLLLQRLVRPDPLFLGLDTAENGASLDACGVPSDFLYTVGPLRKGNLWETIAVPEIRVQVSQLALHLLSRFERPRVEKFVSEQVPAQAWD